MANAEDLRFSGKTMIGIIVIVASLLGAYYTGIQTAESRIRDVANEVVDQKNEAIKQRLSSIEASQTRMDLKLDRMLEAVIERNTPRREDPRSRRSLGTF